MVPWYIHNEDRTGSVGPKRKTHVRQFRAPSSAEHSSGPTKGVKSVNGGRKSSVTSFTPTPLTSISGGTLGLAVSAGVIRLIVLALPEELVLVAVAVLVWPASEKS